MLPVLAFIFHLVRGTEMVWISCQSWKPAQIVCSRHSADCLYSLRSECLTLFLLPLSVVMRRRMLMLVDKSHAVLNQALLTALWQRVWFMMHLYVGLGTHHKPRFLLCLISMLANASYFFSEEYDFTALTVLQGYSIKFPRHARFELVLSLKKEAQLGSWRLLSVEKWHNYCWTTGRLWMMWLLQPASCEYLK